MTLIMAIVPLLYVMNTDEGLSDCHTGVQRIATYYVIHWTRQTRHETDLPWDFFTGLMTIVPPVFADLVDENI